MTDYLRLAQQNALPQQDDTEDNPYLSIALEQQALQQRRARTIIETALKDDPELAAERQRLSQTSGLPLRVIERNLEEVRIKERAKAIDLVRMANESPVLYRQLTDPTFTTTAIDDLGTLEKIERAVGKTAAFVMGADRSGGAPALVETAGLGAAVGVSKMIFDAAGVVNDLIGWDSGAAAARGAAKRMQAYMDENGFQPESMTGQAVKSGLQSAGTNLALLPVGLARNLWTTANQAASAVAGLMSAGVGADAFNRAREQGRSELQAGIYAIPEAAFEFVFERIPASKLFGDVAADETLLRMLGKQMFSEGWTEQVTTLAQDFNEWMNLNQDKTLADYIAERPEAAYQTFVATLVGVGVQTSTIKSIDKIIEKASQQKLQFELDQFNEQLALASQSMLRQRSPEQFRALVQRIVDENTDAKKEIYVDGQVLNQLPADVLAQLPEAVREQIPEAAATNSVVAIPMADVLTIAPGTPLEQILNDNARMTPESLSRIEAQQASEQAQEFLKQEAERVLAQAADQAAWQQSANTVKQTILDQLNRAGRFTSDVNEAYATLQANFFSSMAARVGLTPQELYERYQLKVAAKSPGGEAYNASRGLTVEGYHYSRAPRPVVSTAAFGTGLVGSNRDLYLNAEDRRLRKRAYFYVDKGTGINPEAGVGGIAHKAALTNIYDADADPLRLKKGDQLAFESAVLDAGFSGYLTRMEGTQSGQVIMLGEQEIPTEVIGPATQLRGQVVPPPQARESKGRDVIVDALNANKSLPIGAPTRQRWSALLEAMMPEAHAALKAAGVFDGNPDDNLYKSDLIREFEAATEAPVYGQAAIERLTPVAERGERVTGSRAVITPEEKQAIKESAEKVGVSEREITSVVRKHKLAHPPAQGWAPLVFNRVVVEDGKVIYEYRKTPYDFNTDKEGKALTPGTPEYRRRVNAMARGMVEEVRRVLRRAQAGDKNAQNILAQASWYKTMRSRLRQEFGGLGDLFADLLGATSPNTPVRDNWSNAVDALRRASRGDFDALMPQWEAWADRIDELELDFRAWFNERLAEGLTKKAIKALPEYKAKLDALKEARKLPDNLLPTKEGGKKYGFNGRNVVRALVDLWRAVKNADSDIARGGTAPKALNFSGNLIGFRERATIDVWAARMLQRLAGGQRIPSMAETAVSGEMREDGTTTLQFGFGQDVFSEAVKRIRADEELKADKTLADINDDDLQAVVWFVEKELWTVNNWTNAAGEGGSFELEANLTGSAEQDRIKELRRILDSSKSTPQAKAQAREQLAALERTVDRFVGGLSIQMSADTQGVDYVPTDADMARLANKVRTAIYEADDGNTVLGSKALSTEGRYGGVERSLDLEVVAREGYNANGLWLEMLRQAQAARQDSTFLSRVLRPDEQPDPLRHRPGVEIYFRDAAAAEQLEEVLAELRQQGVEFFTVIVDGRRLSEAVAGAMPPAVGVRLQYVPEFEQRYGMDDLSGLDDVALADKIKQKADELDRLAARVSASVDGVSFAGQFWYDTQVAFSAEYQEKIDALTARTAEGEAAQAGGGVWAGQSIRAGIESANRQLRETSGGEFGGDVLGGNAPVQTGDRGGGYSGGTLAPLEGAPVVEGATGPDPRLVAVAEQYARDNGIDLKRQAVYVDVDPERARRIAAAYEAMPHAPQDPAVKEAYENLIRQTLAQYRALEAAGYRFYFYDETNDPYAGNPWNAMRDLRANQVMGVFATEAGFGSGATDLNVEDNPLLADTGITWPYGSLDGPPKRVLANDLFRAVHDAFGHGLEGAGFRARGEENAWQAHVRLFTGSAVAALTSETRGQNSWLNYGPYGERNRNAKVEDTIFADQKTGLMPEWTWTEGRAPDADEGVFNQAAPTGRPNYQTTYTDPQGETYEIRLTQEVFGVGDGRELTVQVGAFQNGQRRARVDFELQGNTLAAGNTVVAPAYRRRGLAEAMYRAAREAGYDIMPGRKQTADGERMVASLREKGVINVERGLEQGPRGTFNPERLLITLNENADLSTFLHESGHFFLEVLADLASQPDAPQQIKDDMAATLKWFGIKGDEQVGGADSGAPLAQAEERDAVYREIAADEEVVAALEAWMVDGVEPAKEINAKLLAYMRRLPPVPADSYLTFYRGQPEGVAPHRRGWASWTTNKDTTRFFTEGRSEVLERKGAQGINLEELALWRTRATGQRHDYGSQGEWLLLNDSVFAQDGNAPIDNTQPAGRTPLDVWNAMTLDQKRQYHERWAESFEQYLFEGKAPSQELQPLFRRFRSWLINVYKSLKQFMQGRNLQLGDDIRQVFDRLIATDEQIAQAEEAAGMLPDFEATNEAIEKLQARSLRDLKWTVNARNKALKALQKQAAKLRKEVEAEVRAEVEQQPVYRAMRWLKKGETIDPKTGDLVKAEKGYRLSTDALAEMYPETMLGRPDLTRLRGMTAKNGLHPDLVADMFGFASGDQLVRALLDAQPINEVIEGMTDQRMLERYGDLATPEAREAAANEAVHNEARARALATELKSQAEMINQRQDTGRRDARGRAITVNAVVEAAKQFGLNLAARRRIKDLKNAAWQHRAAEARAGKRWQQLTAEGKTEEAVQAKRDQLLNHYAAKALQDAQAEVKKTLEFFKRVVKDSNEKTVEKGRDPDVVNAMRAILAAYGVAPRLEKSALAYMETVAKNDPAMYAALKPSVDSALLNAKPLDELTLEELRGLNDELRAMWELAKRSRQMEVDGNLLDIEEAADELLARMQEIGIPAEIPGERAAITDREEAGIKLQFAKAILSRVEQWAERMDGKFGGPFLRLVFQPIKEAADAYRTARVDYRKRFTALVENIAPILRPGAIPAPELGYTFGNARDSGQAELLHAILHTGNESNRRKLLLGRGWATELEDGTLDTSRWDAFIARMINEGKITKAHYDFAQGVWDLLEEMKPLAQETHRKVFGRYFAEVTATPFDTPFGTYRGGYVPAQTDPRIVKDAKLRELAEAENESMAYAFPASPSGFTKARVEYNKPLLLDLRALAQHMDKVLLFSYMQGPVTDVRRLLTNKRVSYALDRIDPGAYEGMLIPWLNRAAKQIVETPVAGDRKLSRFLSTARSRAGMALMFANLSNTFQQITGFSMAAVKVKPSLMMKATASFIADPKAMKEQVATASEFMRNRMLNEVAAMNDAVEQILVDATVLEKAQAWTQRHAYFLQAAVDNTMSSIIWTAAYNQAIEQQMNHKDAVRFADGVIRQTQGTTLPEDISRFESGPAYARLFTQFVSYFNMMANTNATAMKQIVGEMGLRKGAGRLLYVALAGLLVPIWVAEAIALAFRGGPEDEDDDGYLDDWLMAVFGMGTLRGVVAQVPIVGQAAQLVVNRFNDNPADDKFSLSPAVSLLESAVSSPASVYKAIVDDGNAQKAVRDVAAAATLITGLPIYAAARPVGYLAGVADERIEPTGPMDLARGLVTGTASPESRVP